MSKEEKELLIDALLFYKDERRLDDLQVDNNYQYFDMDENGNITYSSRDVKDAVLIDKLIATFA